MRLKILQKNNLIILPAIILLVLLSSWQALNFHFWKDDWVHFWMAYYRPDLLLLRQMSLADHPGATIEQSILGPFLGLDPFYWQLEGLILKILASISVSLLMLGVTRSHLSAAIAGLLFASSPLGIESFTWAMNHVASLSTIFFGVGFYFWATSLEEIKFFKYFCAIPFIMISFFISPARSAALPILVIFWDLVSLIRSSQKKIIKFILLRDLLLIVQISFLSLILHRGSAENVSRELLEKLGQITSNFSTINNYLSSIGNLILGWIITRPEIASLSIPTFLSSLTALVFLGYLGVIAGLFIKSRTFFLQTQLFFSSFILLSYLPNWWFYNFLVVGPTHRYLSLSAVGLMCLLTVFIIRIGKRFVASVVVLLIFLNIIYSNLILSSQLPYRSKTVVDKIWNQISNEVGSYDGDLVFIYLGEDPYRLMLLDWSSTVPFAIKRGIKDPERFLILIYDKDVLNKLVCGEKVSISSVEKPIQHETVVPLENVYAWGLNGETVINYSEQFRQAIKKEAPCKLV